jgi:polyhydroxyalkanoate synthase subunit PhaC
MRTPHSSQNLYAQLDWFRRALGTQLDTLGVSPLETPSRAALTEPCLTLKAYSAGPDTGPVLLLVPAPIKRAYLWDLAPWASVVRQCIATGLRVYLLQWEQPGERERAFGLADFADRLILDCVEAMQAETGQPSVFLAGHSLGGTLAALFAALHPDRLSGLIVLGAPLHFGRQVGVFGPVVAASPSARILTAALGNVPGSLLDAVCWLTDPVTFGWSRWVDWPNSLPDPEALWTHLLVERWTLDELPLPQRFFEDIHEWLYREDRFMQGTLVLGDSRVAPQQVTAPLLSVVDRHCPITPPEAILPFHEAVPSTAKDLLWYEGDTGVALQHVGPLVGRKAHQQLWPAIIRWIQAHVT